MTATEADKRNHFCHDKEEEEEEEEEDDDDDKEEEDDDEIDHSHDGGGPFTHLHSFLQSKLNHFSTFLRVLCRTPTQETMPRMKLLLVVVCCLVLSFLFAYYAVVTRHSLESSALKRLEHALRVENTWSSLASKFPLTAAASAPFFAPASDQLHFNDSHTRLGQQPPTVLFYEDYSNGNATASTPAASPSFSVLLIVFNNMDEGVLEGDVRALLSLTRSPFELIVVFNAQCPKSLLDMVCRTMVEYHVNRSLHDSHSPTAANYLYNADLQSVLLIHQPSLVSQPTLTNLALRAAHGKYWVLVDAGFRVTDNSWNEHLQQPMLNWPNEIVAVSGSCARTLYSTNVNGADEHQQRAGWCAGASAVPDLSRRMQCTFSIRDTVERGAVLLSAERVRQLHYFDEYNYDDQDEDILQSENSSNDSKKKSHQDEDLHDLLARAYFEYGWKSGWMPLDFEYNPPRLSSSSSSSSSSSNTHFRQHNNTGFLAQLPPLCTQLQTHTQCALPSSSSSSATHTSASSVIIPHHNEDRLVPNCIRRAHSKHLPAYNDISFTQLTDINDLNRLPPDNNNNNHWKPSSRYQLPVHRNNVPAILQPHDHYHPFTPLHPYPTAADGDGSDPQLGIVVSFASLGFFGELFQYGEQALRLFLTPYNYTWMIAYPYQSDLVKVQQINQELLHIIDHFHLQRLDGSPLIQQARKLFKQRSSEVSDEVSALMNAEGQYDGKYLTKFGTIMILQGMTIDLPQFIQVQPELLKQADWMRCANRNWTVEYALYSGAFFTHHLLTSAILQQYHFWIKMDIDIIWRRQIDVDIFEEMMNQKCVFMHSLFWEGSDGSCQQTSPQAFQTYRRLIHQANAGPPNYIPYSYFYGNFVGGWVGFFASKENLQFSEFLYEHWWTGYFKHRWGDQISWPMMMAMFLNITTNDDPRLCNFQRWRNQFFRHVTG